MTSAAAAAAAIIPAVTRLSSRIIRILGCNPSPMTLQGTNTYLIGTGRDRILLDTGDADHPAYIQHLCSVLRSENARIATILLTHWHHDHIGGCGDVLRAIRDATPASAASNTATTTTTAVWKYRRTDAAEEYDRDWLPDGVTVRPLADAQTFAVDGATVRIVHTPGHTTDHVCVQLDEERALFSGDCILGEGSAVFEDLFEYMRSLRSIAETRPERIYPAHGNVIEEPLAKIEWYIQHRERRERQLLEAMVAAAAAASKADQRGWTAMELVAEVYGAEVPEVLWPAAAQNVQLHMRKLCREGRLVEAEERRGGEAEMSRVWRLVAGGEKPLVGRL